MKEMLERICSKQVVFTSLEMVDSKTILNTRKKLAIFSGTDRRSFYHLIFRSPQKSRLITKHVHEIIEFTHTLELHFQHAYKYKHLLVQAPLCSKAALLLHENGWKVYE